MNEKESLQAEIYRLAIRENRFGWGNYVFAYGVAFLALMGSLTAVFLILFDADPKITAIFAAIPAFVIAVTNIFNFERRAVYHWSKSKKLAGLVRKLKYEKPKVEQVSQEFTQIEVDTLNEWVMFDIHAVKRGMMGRE